MALIMPQEGGPGIGIPMTPYSFGNIPSISSQLIPRFKWRSFIAFISAIDVLMFIATLVYAGATGQQVFANTGAGPDGSVLGQMGAKYEPCIREGEVYRLLLPIILHAGIVHIVFNLYFQLHFGFTFELRWTWPRLALIYLFSGIGASLMSSTASPSTVSVGASGALAGMLGADIAYLAMNWSDIPQNTNEACNLACVLLINLLFGFAPTDSDAGAIDNYAHLGGLLMGIFCGAFLCPPLHMHPKTLLYQGIGSFLAGVFALTMLLLIYLKPIDTNCPCIVNGAHVFVCGQL